MDASDKQAAALVSAWYYSNTAIVDDTECRRLADMIATALRLAEARGLARGLEEAAAVAERERAYAAEMDRADNYEADWDERAALAEFVRDEIRALVPPAPVGSGAQGGVAMSADKPPLASACEDEVGWVCPGIRRRKAITWRPSPPVPGELDPGIAYAVHRLQEHGVETFESCEGGAGHADPEPIVRFHGTDAAGWRALAVCKDFGLPVLFLRRSWSVLEGEVTGPHWELVFRHPAHRAWEATL